MRALASRTDASTLAFVLPWCVAVASCTCQDGQASAVGQSPPGRPSWTAPRRVPPSASLEETTPDETVGHVSFLPRPDASKFFNMAPSISTDGKWVAAILNLTASRRGTRRRDSMCCASPTMNGRSTSG
jgi:hypothetical protein